MMPALTRCLTCRTDALSPLLLIHEDGAPHGTDGHAFTHAYTLLSQCGSCGVGQVEVLSHDCFHYFGDDPWDLWWFHQVDRDSMAILEAAVMRCPAPLDIGVPCAVRAQLERGLTGLTGKARAVDHLIAARLMAQITVAVDGDDINICAGIIS